MDEYGGAQIHVRDLSTWLKGQGHDVLVLSGWPGRVSDFVQAQGASYIEIPDLVRPISLMQDLRAIRQIYDALCLQRPDILSCHSSKAGLLGRIAVKLANMKGVPVRAVFTAHGWAFTDGVPFAQRLLYRCIEKCAGFITDHAITVSVFDRDLALKSNILPAHKVTAVHNGMPDYPCPAREIVLGRPVRLLMVARFGPQKDHDTLLKALARCVDLPWVLDLVGGGDDMAVRALCQNLGIEDRVHFHGESENIASFMERADVYFLISHWEGFPRSILEAMRAALPVIATRVAGVGEAVIDRQTGILVAPSDVAGLESAVREMLSDLPMLHQMGVQGRKRFEEDFTFSVMVAKTIQIYKVLLQNHD